MGRQLKLCFHEWLTSYNMLACFVAICVAIATFWPYMAGYSDTFLETSPVRRSLASVENLISATVEITLAMPLLIDTLMDGVMDLLQARQSMKRNKNHSKEHNVVNVLERLFMCFGFIINPANTFAALSSNGRNVALLSFCCTRARLISVVGAVVLSLCRNPIDIMSARVGAFIVSLMTISMSISSYTTLEGLTGSRLQLSAPPLVTRGYLKWRKWRKPTPSADLKTNIEPTARTNIRNTKSVANLGGIFFQGDNEDSCNGMDGPGKESLYFSLTYCATLMLCVVAIAVTLSPGNGLTYADFTPSAVALQHVGYSVLGLGV